MSVKIKTIRFRDRTSSYLLSSSSSSFQLATLGWTSIRGGEAKVAGSEERNATTVESDEEGAEALLLGLCFSRTNKRDLPRSIPSPWIDVSLVSNHPPPRSWNRWRSTPSSPSLIRSFLVPSLIGRFLGKTGHGKGIPIFPYFARLFSHGLMKTRGLIRW